MATRTRRSKLALFGGPKTISPESDFKSSWPRMGLEKALLKGPRDGQEQQDPVCRGRMRGIGHRRSPA